MFYNICWQVKHSKKNNAGERPIMTLLKSRNARVLRILSKWAWAPHNTMLPLVVTVGNAPEQVATQAWQGTKANVSKLNNEKEIISLYLSKTIFHNNWSTCMFETNLLPSEQIKYVRQLTFVNSNCWRRWSWFWNQPQTAPQPKPLHSSWGCSLTVSAVAAASLCTNTQTEDQSAECQRLKIICLYRPRPDSLKPECLFLFITNIFAWNEAIEHVRLSKDDNESFLRDIVRTPTFGHSFSVELNNVLPLNKLPGQKWREVC